MTLTRRHASGRFSEDVERWIAWGRIPRDGRPSGRHHSAATTLKMLWRHPGLGATALFRAAQWADRHHLRGLPSVLERANLVLFGLEASSSIEVGPGLYIAHPSGTVLMARSIGSNASFIHAVTLGMRNRHEFPELGDGVFVGAGARILGGIRLGDGCSVGAGAVVVDDVPAGATVVGVPARRVGERLSAVR